MIAGLLGSGLKPICFESIRDLVTNAEPESSTIGIGVAMVSIIVMPTLGFAKKRLADTMGSPVLRADAAEEYDEERLPGAINIPLKKMDEQGTAQLDKKRPVIVYC